jgi:hypothetical protein
MSFNIAFSGTFSTPPYTGQSDCPVPINLTVQYDCKSCHRYELSGSGTQAVDLGSLPSTGAKMLVVQVDADASPAAAPINLRINSGTDDWEVDTGGFLAMGSPEPVTGITAVDIVHTADVKVWVWAFG